MAALIEGALSILAGVIAIALRGIAGLAVLYVVAAWTLLNGLSRIASAVRGRTEHEWPRRAPASAEYEAEHDRLVGIIARRNQK